MSSIGYTVIKTACDIESVFYRYTVIISYLQHFLNLSYSQKYCLGIINNPVELINWVNPKITYRKSTSRNIVRFKFLILSPGSKPLYFLVDFLPLQAGEHADAYFGLLEALEELLDRRVDLVMARAIKNPYFLEAIRSCRTVVYAA